MKITWYGTASILLSAKSGSILFDPYLKRLLKDQEPKQMLEQRLQAFCAQKNVFITHGHFDHLAHVTQIYKNLPCKVYLTQAPYKRLLREGMSPQKLQLISVGDTIEVDGFSVCALKGKHVKFKTWDLIKGGFSRRQLAHPVHKFWLCVDYCKYLEKKQTLFFEITVEGKRIQIMGSADLDKNVQYPTGADVLILPHQGRSDIDQHNAKIVQRLQPKRVLLDHYDDAFPPFSNFVDVQNFCKETSPTIPTEPLVEGQTVEI